MTDRKEMMWLRGWPAVLVLLVLLAFGAWKTFIAHSEVDSEAAEKLKTWIQSEYHRKNLAEYREQPGQLKTRIEQIENLGFRGIAARGAPDDLVVKVEVAPIEAEPPGTDHVRYFRMRYSPATGWQLRHEVNVISWWLAWI